jgi:type IV secretory pathway TrbD component
MLTKPAAAGAQILGVIITLYGVGDGSWFWGLFGVALFILGGAATRQRIKQDQQRARSSD